MQALGNFAAEEDGDLGFKEREILAILESRLQAVTEKKERERARESLLAIIGQIQIVGMYSLVPLILSKCDPFNSQMHTSVF